MKKIYLSILMTLCPLLPGMAQQVSQTGRETVGQPGLRSSAAQTPMPFLQEGKEWYYRSVYAPRGADENYYRKISGDTLVGRVFKNRIKIWYKKWCYIGVSKLLIFNTLVYKMVLCKFA